MGLGLSVQRADNSGSGGSDLDEISNADAIRTPLFMPDLNLLDNLLETTVGAAVDLLMSEDNRAIGTAKVTRVLGPAGRIVETQTNGSASSVGALAIIIPEVFFEVVDDVLPDTASVVLAGVCPEVGHIVVVLVRLATDISNQDACHQAPDMAVVVLVGIKQITDELVRIAAVLGFELLEDRIYARMSQGPWEKG